MSSTNMFNFLKPKSSSTKKQKTESALLKLSGLHCTSCAVDIDLTLEELPGVKSSTNYAKSQSKIVYDPELTSLKKIHSTIHKLGYSID